MTFPRTLMFCTAALLTLSACAQAPGPSAETTKLDHSALFFHDDPIHEGSIDEQVAALNTSADRLVKASTLHGAALGAAVGCGLTVLSAGNARNCVAAAAIGGGTGALVGNAAGKKDVQRRVALVDANAVVRSLRAANRQMENVQDDLPALIAAQEKQLNKLTVRFAAGDITRAEHDTGVAEIRAHRAGLAEALNMSAQDARTAARNLERAAEKGQTGLDWHIQNASDLAEEATSARSQLSLL
ncbi:hypothetical protein [Tateyamaria sp. SN6-1]|uniref:hypothetical protein n=1 Tax=Tateyamaria sp. SN6-1 TaxID=3092148 RepID=UPI0039F47758